MIQLIYSVIAIIIHEAFHCLAVRIFNSENEKPKLALVGLNLRIDFCKYNYWEIIIILSSGPIGNITIGLILVLINEYIRVVQIRELIIVNFIIGFFNLLPMRPLDGGQILYYSVKKNRGEAYAITFNNYTSKIIRILILILALVQMFTVKNISLLLLYGYFCFQNNNDKSVIYLNIKNLMYRKSRILKNKFYEVRNIIVLEELTFEEILSKLDYDRFHIIHVINKEFQEKLIFTEEQLFKAIEKGDGKRQLSEVKTLDKY